MNYIRKRENLLTAVQLLHMAFQMEAATEALPTGRTLNTSTTVKYAVLWILIRMLLCLPDPHPDPLVTSTDPDPDPSIIKQK